MSFSLLDLFLAMGIGQGLMLLIAIPRMGNAPRSATRWLQVIITLSLVMLVGRIMYLEEITEFTIRFGTFIDVTIFLFGPTTYLYLRSFIYSNGEWPVYPFTIL